MGSETSRESPENTHHHSRAVHPGDTRRYPDAYPRYDHYNVSTSYSRENPNVGSRPGFQDGDGGVVRQASTNSSQQTKTVVNVFNHPPPNQNENKVMIGDASAKPLQQKPKLVINEIPPFRPKPSIPNQSTTEGLTGGSAFQQCNSSQRNNENKAMDAQSGSSNAKKSGGSLQQSVSKEDVSRRDSSPAGSECSNPGKRDKSRNRWHNKPKPRVPPNRNDPPKYEDIMKQSNNYNKNSEKTNDNNFHKNASQGSTSNFNKGGDFRKDFGLGDKSGKNVDALNDLIKKKFGSVGASTHNLPPSCMNERLFSGRNCLYVGNLPPNMTREDVNELMEPYGETVIDFYNSEKRFGFIRLKHREQTENAQRNLDGYTFRGRTLRVRFSSNTARVKVLNLDEWVTNELLEKAFSAFGEVERAEIVTENGKPSGTGFVEFSDKRAGKVALKACAEHCFLLTSSSRPVILEEMDQDSNTTGFSERQLSSNGANYKKAREIGPRFLTEGSAEYNGAVLWKKFYERRKQEEEELAKKHQAEQQQLESRIETLIKAFKG